MLLAVALLGSLLLHVGSSGIPARAAADISGPGEYQIKAVYLFNFANFVTWPASVFSAGDAFRICVLGDDPFKQGLDLAVENEKIEGRKVEIIRTHDLDKISQCQIVYVSDSERWRLSRVLEQVKQKPVLTVSDTKDFAAQGGMVEFLTRSNQVRFAISPAIVEQAGLKASANLLRLATIVSQDDKK
jgi:hypothetical protein